LPRIYGRPRDSRSGAQITARRVNHDFRRNYGRPRDSRSCPLLAAGSVNGAGRGGGAFFTRSATLGNLDLSEKNFRGLGAPARISPRSSRGSGARKRSSGIWSCIAAPMLII
jgi:hypothetical protein